VRQVVRVHVLCTHQTVEEHLKRVNLVLLVERNVRRIDRLLDAFLVGTGDEVTHPRTGEQLSGRVERGVRDHSTLESEPTLRLTNQSNDTRLLVRVGRRGPGRFKPGTLATVVLSRSHPL